MSMVHGTDEERSREGNQGIKGAMVERKKRSNYSWVSDAMLLAVYRAAAKNGEGIDWITDKLNAIKEARGLQGDYLRAPSLDSEGKQVGGSVNGLAAQYKKVYGEDSLPKLSRGREKREALSKEALEAGAAEFDSFFE